MPLTNRPAVFMLTVAAVLLLWGQVSATRADDFPRVTYELVESSYQEGCFEPCLCPLMQEQPMTGTFDLVFYPFAGPLWTVAVEQVDWKVLTLGKQLVGQGTYRRAGDMQEMHLDLQIDGQPATAFDSDWVPGGESYPLIDVTLSKNGLFCYDIALRVRARPVDTTPRLTVDDTMLTWNAVPDAPSYDVVCGDLMQLRANGGDFGETVDLCLADDLAATSLPHEIAVEPDQAVWFLVRAQGASYDAGGSSQVGSRDEEISNSPLACP